MAEFVPAFENCIKDEGGYQLTETAGDHGGQTYAGISRRFNPQWPGWTYIDAKQIPPSQLVRDFYKANYWDPILGDQIADQEAAESIFGFAVNTSAAGHPTVAVKVLQLTLGVTPDGDFGPKTLAALNSFDPKLFRALFAIAKIARYCNIVHRDKSQLKWLPGWINRVLETV